MTMSNSQPRDNAEAGGSDTNLSLLLAYWEAKRGERAMPARKDIDPLDIPRLLPDIFLVDVLDDGDYQYRLVGGRIVERAGANYTGLKLSEIASRSSQPLLLEIYEHVLATRRPVQRELPYRMRFTRIPSSYKVLVMPLSADGERVDMLLGITAYPDAAST
jgi:hypothetical protein